MTNQLADPVMLDETRITRAWKPESGIVFLVTDQIPKIGQAYANGVLPVRHRLTKGKPTKPVAFTGQLRFRSVDRGSGVVG